MVAVASRDMTVADLETMLGSLPDESWALVDASGRMIYAVGPPNGVLGHGAREGTHLAEYAHPDDLPGVLDGIEHVLASPGSLVRTRARALHGDGTYRLYEVAAVNRLDDPAIGAVVVRTTEVYEDSPTVSGVIESLAESVPTPILLVDHAANVLYSNESARRLVGDEIDTVAATLAAARDSTITLQLRESWVQARVAARSAGIVAMLDDITTHRREAMTDRLTGLANRAEFDERLAVALSVDGAPVSIVFVDLDGFKGVNDNLGHAAGDQVLKVVAARLKAVVRPGDVVARIGGDEFGVICHEIDAVDVAQLADRLVEAVREPMNVGRSRVVVGASAGTAATPPVGRDAAELLAAADEAMYRDKAEVER
jgi:diguanylate cyclase (GGDEF)-like protein